MLGSEVVDVNTERFYRMLAPRQTVIVSSGTTENPNASTVMWSTPISFDPPLVAIALHPLRYTHELIEKTGMFAINIPTMDILSETYYLGTHSGRDEDKFATTGLTPGRGHVLDVPIVEESVASIECSVQSAIELGDHTLFIGMVENVITDPDSMDPWGIDIEAEMIYWRDSTTAEDAYTLIKRQKS